MKVCRGSLLPLIVLLACAVLPNSAQGQDPNAHIYVAHGVPGRNISSTTDPSYPVDISVQGNCLGQGLAFGEMRGPFSGPPGTYSVVFTVANLQSPCGGDPVFTAPVTVAAGTSSLGILALNSSNQVTGLIYPIDLSSVPVGLGRVIVANTSSDNLTGILTVGDTDGSPASANIGANSLFTTFIPSGEYSITFTPEGSTEKAAGPLEVDIASRNVYLYVIAGSVMNSTIQLVGPTQIKGVF